MDGYDPMSWYIGTEWTMPAKGLRKKVLSLENIKFLDKPHLVSKVMIKVEEVQYLTGRESQYLSNELIEQDQIIEIGSALSPVDYYVELLVRQFVVGERAHCFIATKKEEISFILTLLKIEETKEIYTLNVTEMYALAKRYKENGVVMFKHYPIFSHAYFSRAAKFLISCKPFEGLIVSKDGISSEEMQTLFTQIQTNLAACLLNEHRYEDVLYQTKFVEEHANATEKSIYRRAMAFYHLKEFEKAQKLIAGVPNYQRKKEFAELLQRLEKSWRTSNEQYKNVVKRMFR